MIVRVTFLVIIKKILKWAENILSRNKLQKNTISKQGTHKVFTFFKNFFYLLR